MSSDCAEGPWSFGFFNAVVLDYVTLHVHTHTHKLTQTLCNRYQHSHLYCL